MNKIIHIGDKEVGVSINALTPELYHKTFKKNFFEEIQNITTDIGVLKEITYIGARRYETENPGKIQLSVDDFYEWLEQFDMFDFEWAGAQIAEIINEQSKTTVAPKH